MDIKYFADGKPHLIKQKDFVKVVTSEEFQEEITKEIDEEILRSLTSQQNNLTQEPKSLRK
ncbi:MAG: hypothetical protein EKK64_00735 [Neisseriaceae bacterium]|nr:MAG: hypothetical protein EKK64_00735 [Neisseriaceae bacterium]